MAGYGNTEDYFRRMTSAPVGGGAPAWGNVNIPMPDQYRISSAISSPHMQNDSAAQYATQYAKFGQRQLDNAGIDVTSKMQVAAQQGNIDAELLKLKLAAEAERNKMDLLEAGRSRDHALTMQARGFENDDYSAAAQQFRRYGLGGYF